MKHSVYRFTVGNFQAIVAAATFEDAIEQFEAIVFAQTGKKLERYEEMRIQFLLNKNDH